MKIYLFHSIIFQTITSMVGLKNECANVVKKKDKPIASHDVTIEDDPNNEEISRLVRNPSSVPEYDYVKTIITPTEFTSDLSDTPSYTTEMSSALNPLMATDFSNSLMTPEGFSSARATSIDTSPTPLGMMASSFAPTGNTTKTGPSAGTKTPRLATRSVGTSTVSPGTGTGGSGSSPGSGVKSKGSTGYGTRPSGATGTGYGTRQSAPSEATGTAYGTRQSAGTGTASGSTSTGTTARSPAGTGYDTTRPTVSGRGTRYTTTQFAPTDSDGSPCYFYEPKFDQVITSKDRYKFGVPKDRNRVRRDQESYDRQRGPKVATNKTSQLRLAWSRHMSFSNRAIHVQPHLPKTIGKYVPKDTFDQLHIVKPRPAPKDEPYSVPFRNNRTTQLRYMYNQMPTSVRRKVGELETLPIETLDDQPHSTKNPVTGEMNYVLEGVRYEPLTVPPVSPAKEKKTKTITTSTSSANDVPSESKPSPESPPAPVVSRKSPVVADKRARELQLREQRKARLKRLRRLPFRV